MAETIPASPTIETIKYIENVYDKVLDRILAKTKVEDNLISGECICYEQIQSINSIIVACRFKINGNEFTIKGELDPMDFKYGEKGRDIDVYLRKGHEFFKSVCLWFTLKVFSLSAFEQIAGYPFSNN